MSNALHSCKKAADRIGQKLKTIAGSVLSLPQYQEGGTVPYYGASLIGYPEVEQRTTLSRRQIDRLIRENRFPAKVYCGSRVAFIEEEVVFWINDRAAISRAGPIFKMIAGKLVMLEPSKYMIH